LAGVKQLENLTSGRFRLQIEDGQSMAELIASAAVTQDWGLQELIPEQQTLEQIFVELTSGEIAEEQVA
ncbi:MAG: ABC transporter ATP-binding protein, partial [Gammaproteobacteria bacterium]|nr:ABC transporter ATP-binding protein [Gammaproteobacteria bacterium]